MFELPEFATLAKQMNDTLKVKTIRSGQLGNSHHKFAWYNRKHDEFDRAIEGVIHAGNGCPISVSGQRRERWKKAM